MTPHELNLIARHTRGNGVIPWQSLSTMIGRHPSSLKAEWEALASMPISLTPPNIGPIDMLPEPECYRSTRAKGPGLRMKIIYVLVGRKLSAETVAGLCGVGIKSARVRLSQLQADGVVEHGARMPFVWSLTNYGLEVWQRERRSRADEEKAA